MTEKKKVGYKQPPTENQWKLGQSGNPSGKKKVSINPPQPLPETLAAVLSELGPITIAGKKQTRTLGQILARTYIQNAINGSPKQQGDALKNFKHLGVFDAQNLLSVFTDADDDPFSEEDRRRLKIVQNEMDGSNFDELG